MSEHTLYSGTATVRIRKGHHYEVRDETLATDGWIEMPSVTTVLRVYDKSGPLTQWAANCAIEYLRQHMNPGTPYSAAELAAAFQEARFNFRSVSLKACDVGTIAHEWIERYLRWMLEGGVQPVMPDNEQALRSCTASVKWLREHDVEPISIELPLYSRKYGYCGRMDNTLLMRVHGRLALGDWKTSKAIYPEYRMQAAAYAQAYQEMYGIPIAERIIIRIDKETAEFEDCNLDIPESTQARDLQGFLHCLGLWRWKKSYLEASHGRQDQD